MSEVITADLVDLDLKAADRQSASRQLAERLVAAGRVTDIEGFLADIAKRESQMPTGLEGGIGIPHCRSAHVARAEPRVRPRQRRRRLRGARRPGRHHLPDRGAGGWRRVAHEDPRVTGPEAHPGSVQGEAAFRAGPGGGC